MARDSKITITITIAEAEALLIAALEQQVVFPENRDLERGKMACSKAIHDHCENGYTQEPTPFELLGTPTLRRCDYGSQERGNHGSSAQGIAGQGLGEMV